MIGQLYGIGMGPGDPELVTLKALRLLKESPVIAYPKKKKGEKSYALSIAQTYIDPREKEMLGLVFPMTQDPEILEREWNRTVEAIWERLSQGKNVVFVTEGDPLLYSTFIHLNRRMQALHPEVKISSVPGISSISGAASCLNVDLADGDEQIAIIPATKDREAMRKALAGHDTVVFLKVAKVLDMIIDLLEELDLDDRAMVVSKATSDQEVVWKSVAQLKGQNPGYLTLMVVRK
ncbi:precorrin-2 C(20)-methyltransferase [Thermoactinomyces mirandus]|uniref:Precorrin-2 C(20)-methyltransferase n=1 Tax=Thermoactinomyces mirandus TaxID=2756294 RepID=A0A7W1XV04_9BACL|nr:precorrin-2 C(20)-methyltransferase [Thermoactinomyces mirandus]MBA4603691.1 precorrin-2 C(20)-methyltransferase [Thermoactinomyces mirandus]